MQTFFLEVKIFCRHFREKFLSVCNVTYPLLMCATSVSNLDVGLNMTMALN